MKDIEGIVESAREFVSRHREQNQEYETKTGIEPMADYEYEVLTIKLVMKSLEVKLRSFGH